MGKNVHNLFTVMKNIIRINYLIEYLYNHNLGNEL